MPVYTLPHTNPPKTTDHHQSSQAEPQKSYDDPNLSPKEFLLAVMRNRTISLATRMDAACELLKLWPHPCDYVPPVITIRIPELNIAELQAHVELHPRIRH